MAIYNLGQLPTQESEVNPFMSQLMDFGFKSTLQGQQIQGQKEIASADRVSQLKVATAKAEQEQNEKSREYLDAVVQKAVDKFGHEEFTRLSESDKGYSDLYKRYVKLHPEFTGITDIGATLPHTTKDQIKTELDSQINIVKNKLLTSGPDSLDPGERALIQMEGGFKDDFADVVSSAIRNPQFAYMTPEEQQNSIKQGMELLKSRDKYKSPEPLPLPTPKDASYRPNNMSEWATQLSTPPRATPTKTEEPKPTRFKVKRIK